MFVGGQFIPKGQAMDGRTLDSLDFHVLKKTMLTQYVPMPIVSAILFADSCNSHSEGTSAPTGWEPRNRYHVLRVALFLHVNVCTLQLIQKYQETMRRPELHSARLRSSPIYVLRQADKERAVEPPTSNCHTLSVPPLLAPKEHDQRCDDDSELMTKVNAKHQPLIA
jgi:hypothetical protein